MAATPPALTEPACRPGCTICKGSSWAAYRPHTLDPGCWCEAVKWHGQCELVLNGLATLALTAADPGRS